MFAFVAIAAAETQWLQAPALDATHMKTAGGDTVSVAAHKAQHHKLKADEYAKKGYAYGYVKPAVYATPAVASYASPLVTYANTYATGMPLYHQLGKREAEADSQYFYNTGIYANGYNGYNIPKVFNGAYNTAIASPVVSYNGLYTNGLYNTYGAGVHAIGKREAEADSQWVYNNGYTPLTGYTGYNALTGYTTPYAYGNVWNRAQYLW